MTHTSILQQLDQSPILSIRLLRKLRVAQRDIEPLDLNGILERNRHAGQRTLEVDLRLSPGLGLGEEKLRHAVCPLMGLDGDFSVGAEHVGGRDRGLVDILDQVLDGLVYDVPVGGGVWSVVGRGERGETVGPFLSLAVPGGVS
jgi:hypothetical protein